MQLIQFDKELYPMLGEPEPDTRIYTRTGPQEEVGHWFDMVTTVAGPTVTLGGVRMYCPVSRPALHERINRGGMTVFQFTVNERKTNFFGTSKTVQKEPYSFVPVSECRSWREEIKERAVAKGIPLKQIEKGDPEWLAGFLEAERNAENDIRKKRPATLKMTLSEYDLESLRLVARELKFDSPSDLLAWLLKPVFDGGFSGLSFTKVGWMLASRMSEYGVGEFPLPKLLEFLRKEKP